MKVIYTLVAVLTLGVGAMGQKCNEPRLAMIPECDVPPADKTVCRENRGVRLLYVHGECDEPRRKFAHAQTTRTLEERVTALESRINRLPQWLLQPQVAPYPVGTLTYVDAPQVKHAHAQQKAVVVPPSTIPVPPEDVAKLKEKMQEYQARMTALQQEADAAFNKIIASAALRAKLTPEQFESMVFQSDGKGGFVWAPKLDKPETPKTETPKP